MTASTTPGRTRRVSRQAEIAAAASTLFRQHGYTNVSMKDIADIVGVSAPALYRHFTGKQHLLAEAISGGLATAEVAARAAHTDGLEALVGALAHAAVYETNLWMLLHREALHLDSDDAVALNARFSGLIALLSDKISAERTPVAGGNAHTQAQAILAALSAPSQYEQRLARMPLASVLTAAALRVVNVANAIAPPNPTVRLLPPFDPALHRREAILGAAATLFAERGYSAVTLDEIGAAVDIAGPSIYNHFESKADVLASVLWRSVDWIESDMTRAITEQLTPADTLRHLYSHYTAMAIGHPELFHAFTVEAIQLPASERNRIGRAHQHFVERWIALLQKNDPTLNSGSARALVSASLCVINDLAHRAWVRDDPCAAPTLTAMAVAVAGL